MRKESLCKIRMKRVLLYTILGAFALFAHALNNPDNSCRRIEITKDQSLASQMRFSTSYYVIRDVFDLEGGIITIPQGCILRFDGGQFKNGTVIGNKSYIEAAPYPIFSGSLTIKGSFDAADAFPEWFENDDDAIKIRKSLSFFDRVKLTAKHYILKSVDENGYGIVVPAGCILEGNRRANNTSGNDQIIEMKKGINYTAVVALSTNSILTNLTIYGPNLKNSSCVATVEGFQSRINIERVGVSGSYYGFNLQVYLSNLSQCVANYNEVGFYIHGSYTGNTIKVEGTSVNLSTCFAVDSKKTGYEIAGITYSTMNNCAADGCGAPASGNLKKDTEIGYAYSFTQSKNLTVNSCGAEYCLAAVKTLACKNIIFNAPSYLINKRKDVRVANSYEMSPIFNIRYSSYIEFNYMFLNAEGMSKYYNDKTVLMKLYGSANPAPSVIIKRGYEGIKECNIGTEGFLVKSKNLVYE